MTTFEDDRTDDQKRTHTIGVAMTDSFMSGWGGAAGGASVAVWACDANTSWERVFDWVKRRSDARRVRTVDLATYRPRAAHVHVYVVTPDHPSLR